MRFMNETIKIADILGPQVRSRVKGDTLREFAFDGKPHVLDMEGVTFISRSFADELCNILESNSLLKVSNASGIVKEMIDIVSKSRKHKRVRKNEDSEIYKFDNLESLSEFLLNHF